MSNHSVFIQWSEEDNAYIAIVPELPGLSAFGSTPEKAAKELAVAKDVYLEVLEEDGDEIPEPEVVKPFSGQTRLRLPKSLHASLAYQARQEGISLNTHIVHLLSERNAFSQVKNEITSLEDTIFKVILSVMPMEHRAESGGEQFVYHKRTEHWDLET